MLSNRTLLVGSTVLCAFHVVSPRDLWLCVLPRWQFNVNVNVVRLWCTLRKQSESHRVLQVNDFSPAAVFLFFFSPRTRCLPFVALVAARPRVRAQRPLVGLIARTTSVCTIFGRIPTPCMNIIARSHAQRALSHRPGFPRQRSRMHTLDSRWRDARASRCRLARSSHTRCICSRAASRAVPYCFEQPRSPACLRSRSRRSARRSTCSTRTTPARSTTASSRPRCAPSASRSRRRSSAR